MTTKGRAPFEVPDIYLSELPTGAVKNAVHELGGKIARGEFAIDAKLPMEAELVEMLGVSRTVVRESIKVLSGKGLIRTARRYGTRVLPFENWNLLDPDVISWHDPNSPAAARIFRDTTELRCIFEPDAAALAALNATKEQRQTILTAAHHISPEPHGNSAMLAADYTFHATILAGSGNTLLRQLHGLVLAVLQFSYPTGARVVPEEKVSQRNHISVAEAIFEADAEAARARMMKMLTQNRMVADRIEERSGAGNRD